MTTRKLARARIPCCAIPHMTLHLPTLLLLCIAALATSAGVMTLFGTTQHTYRGYWWWVAAQWLLTLGMALQLLREAWPIVLPLANLLLLQWPIVVLAGMRRFYSRHGLRLSPSVDWCLLGLAWLAWLVTWAMQGGLVARVAVYAAGAAGLHLYSALLLTRLAEFRDSSALKVLVAVTLLDAVVQLARLAAARPGLGEPIVGDELLLAGGLVLVMTSLVMVYLALLLTNERTEGNLRAMHRKLRFLADIDVLTRVPNRRHFHELARRALAADEPGECALMMFDIDHFKRINDMLGHATGDEALRQVAHCVRESLRAQDVAGRLGGDEFAVLLPGTTVQDAMAVATRIARQLDDRQVAPHLAPLSLSFGMVQMHEGEAVPDALRRADQALYEAKRQGRSRAVIAAGIEEKPVFGESRQLGLTGF
jgi:diguanylate cyclase (GGDEF)-like protein